jgi:uncharacterized membrane protein YcaP (DUF421 family)
MDSVLRGAILYLFLLVIVRLSGRRTIAQATPFDMVLMLIIAETTQQALLGDDYSITNAAVVIVTLALMDVGLSYLKRTSVHLDRLVDGPPTLLISDGIIDHHALQRSRVNLDDILAAARSKHGIATLDAIRHAILESDAGISIIPR